MLDSSYDALRQFQNKFQKTKNLQALKSLLVDMQIVMCIQLTSSSVWILDWQVDIGRLLGTLEIGLTLKLSIGQDLFEARQPRILRLEDPIGVGLMAFEGEVLGLLKEMVDNMH